MTIKDLKVGENYIYKNGNHTISVLCIEVEPNITGAPFFGRTAWFLPNTRTAQLPFSLPGTKIANYISEIPELDLSKA